MRWFLGVAIVIVTALVVAHRGNETVRHRARDAARDSETSSATAAHVASGQASARVPGGTTTLRVNLIGDPEHTSMVMLVPAKGGDRLLPVDVDWDSYRSFLVDPGLYRLTLPGGIVVRGSGQDLYRYLDAGFQRVASLIANRLRHLEGWLVRQHQLHEVELTQ